MSEKKKLIITILAVILIIMLLPLTLYLNYKKGQAYVNKFNDLLNKNTVQIVYLGKTGCSYCELFSPVIDELKNKYNFDYLYIPYDKLTSSQGKKILNDLSVTELGTPYLAFVKDGKKIDEIKGYVEEEVLFAKLQELGIIDKEEKLAINYVDIDEYVEITKQKEPQVVVIGRTLCSYCISAKKILKEIIEEDNIQVNYYNYYNIYAGIASEEETKKFNSSLNYFKENDEWGTPLILVVKNGKVENVFNGLGSKDDYVKFFKENGIIK